MVTIFFAIFMEPGAAAAFVDQRGTVRVAVSAEVAHAIGLPRGWAFYRPIRRKVPNVPDLLRRHVEAAISGPVVCPDAHPLAQTVIV
jgi:hypothetical protein